MYTQVDIVQSRDYVDMSNYVTNGEWSFVGTRIVRNEVQYPIGPAVYPDVTVYVTMRRRILYYMLNIILLITYLIFEVDGLCGRSAEDIVPILSR